MLGGKDSLCSFVLKYPGPDHHARWMAKVIYLLKLHLLSNVFDLTDEEKTNVSRLCVFICLLYVRPWFESPLPCLAPLNDLSFASKVLQYRMVEPVLAFTVLQSIKNHLWYLTPQLVILSLADTRLADEEREEIARTLHATDRVPIEIGKPAFPELDFFWGSHQAKTFCICF